MTGGFNLALFFKSDLYQVEFVALQYKIQAAQFLAIFRLFLFSLGHQPRIAVTKMSGVIFFLLFSASFQILKQTYKMIENCFREGI